MPRSRSRSRERDRDRAKRRRSSRSRSRDKGRGRDRDRSRRDDERRPRDRPRREDERRPRDEQRDAASSADSRPTASVPTASDPTASVDDANDVPRTEPMDLEALVKKRDAQIAEQNKPVFMTKKQRAELALQRRKDQVRQEQRQQQDERSQRNAFMAAARTGGDRYAGQQDRDQQRQREATLATKELEKQKEALKRQYLGSKKEKKKVLKPSEKFRFSFDWDATDDTSRDLNPLYQNKHETQLLFGRGMRAGIDRVVQVKEGHKYLKEVQRRKEDQDGARRERDSSAAGTERSARPAESREERERRHRDQDRLRYALEHKEARMKDSDLGLTGAHWSDKKLDEMTERDWRIFKEDFQIAVKGGRCPKPIRSWAESKLPPQLLKAIAEAKYEKPSAIQMQSIPIGLTNRDMIGLAETGSGKTAAFVLPMLSYIMNHCPELTPEIAEEGPFALIMAPTRELVQQIEVETKKFSRHLGYKVFSIVGGVNIEEQGYALRLGAHIIIASPGRLNDCLENGYMVLNQCNYIVLDEADRMIDLGFAPQIQSVLDAMPTSNMRPEEEEEDEDEPAKKQEDEMAAEMPLYRQTFLFSATMPPAVEKLAKKYCRQPAIIQIGETGRVVDSIEQVVKVVSEGAKPRELEAVMQDLEPPIIVFVNTRAHCDAVSRKIDEIGFNSTILHGGKLQDQRENSINGFREGRYDVLVATNVAGRGIDIPDVKAVINYDVPKNIQDYTHRIGRTGRAGKRGLAVSLLTMEDTDIMYDLKQMLLSTNSIVPRELEHAEAAKNKAGEIKQHKRLDLDK